MTYNYHAHTFWCSHATGKIEDYIKRAIDGGITHMGFSDHMPHICADGYEAAFRVPVAHVREYFDEVNALREKYKDLIDIKIGFEMEYYPDVFEQMLSNAISYGAEYLILGQHFLGEEHPYPIPSIEPTNLVTHLTEYVKCVVEAIKTGVFSYVAHPDMFNYVGDTSVFQSEMRDICIASREYNVPLEVNFLGIRDGRNYPNKAFWKIVGEEKSPVTFGFDAHTVESACDKASLKKAMALVEEFGLNYIGKPEIRALVKE